MPVKLPEAGAARFTQLTKTLHGEITPRCLIRVMKFVIERAFADWSQSNLQAFTWDGPESRHRWIFWLRYGVVLMLCSRLIRMIA